MCDAALELYNDLLETEFDEYYDLIDAKRSKIDAKYNPANLKLDEYTYSVWYNETSVKHFTTISSNRYSNGRKYGCIKRFQKFLFLF